MKMSLDKAFCQYAISNNLLSSKLVAEYKCDEQSDNIPVREQLLLDGELSLPTYRGILDNLKKLDTVDSERSQKWDKRFTNYLRQHSLISQRELETFQRKAAENTPISVRELLLAAEIISLDLYSKIMKKLKKTTADKKQECDVSADTVIDENPIKEETQEYDLSADTLIDTDSTGLATGRKKNFTVEERDFTVQRRDTDRVITALEKQLDDPESEGVLDVSDPEATIDFDPRQDRNATIDFSDEKAETITYAYSSAAWDPAQGPPPDERPKTTVEIPPEQLDPHATIDIKSVPSVVDQHPTISIGEGIPIDPETPQVQRQEDIEATLDMDSPIDYNDATLDISYIETTSKTIDSEVTLDMDYNREEANSERVSPHRTDPRIQEASEKTIASPTLDIDPRYTDPQSIRSGRDEFPSVETLVREITQEINLQTQSISNTLIKDLSKHKSLMGSLVFLYLFTIALFGGFEFWRWQKTQDLIDSTKEQKMALVQAREQLDEAQSSREKEQRSFSSRDYQHALLYWREQKYDKARDCFFQVVEGLDEKSYGKEKLYSYIASCYENMGELENAQKHYEKAMFIARDKGIYLHHIGRLYSKRKKYDEALKYYSQAENLPAILELDKIDAWIQTNQWEKARSAIDSLFLQGEKIPTRLYFLNGTLCLLQKQHDNAIAAFKKVLEQKSEVSPSSYVKAHIGVGDAYSAQKKYREAYDILRKAALFAKYSTDERISERLKREVERKYSAVVKILKSKRKSR